MGTPSITKWYVSLDTENMMAHVKLLYAKKKNEEVSLPFRYIMCDACDGTGPCKACNESRLLPVPNDEKLNKTQQGYFDLLLEQIMVIAEMEDVLNEHEHIHT